MRYKVIMETPIQNKMKIHLANHYGMCFGVRDAIAKTQIIAQQNSTTVLGELVHNPVVQKQLDSAGIKIGSLDYPLDSVKTEAVVFTAHGVADSVRKTWAQTGKQVFDTTCPLVKKAHRSLECLVLAGYKPVVIGRPDHVEVRGLVTDFPEAIVLLEESELEKIPGNWEKIGIVSQTTQPVSLVENLVAKIRTSRPNCEVKFIDTICQPTKNRQKSLIDLSKKCDTVVVVGGNNSNNTKQLANRAADLGCKVVQIETADDLRLSWFTGSQNVGVTAGTSTLEETVQQVVARLEEFSREKQRLGLFDSFKAIA